MFVIGLTPNPFGIISPAFFKKPVMQHPTAICSILFTHSERYFRPTHIINVPVPENSSHLAVIDAGYILFDRVHQFQQFILFLTQTVIPMRAISITIFNYSTHRYKWHMSFIPQLLAYVNNLSFYQSLNQP